MSIAIDSLIKSCPFLADPNKPVQTKVSTFLGKREVTFCDRGQPKTVDIEEIEKAFARAAASHDGFNGIVDIPEHKAALDRLVSLGKAFDKLQEKSAKSNLISKLFRSTVTPTPERRELRSIQHDADEEIQFLANTDGLDDELFGEDFKFPGFSSPQLKTTYSIPEDIAIPSATDEDTSSSDSSVSPRSSASSERPHKPDVWLTPYSVEKDRASVEKHQRSFTANTQRYIDADRTKTKPLDFKKESGQIGHDLRAIPVNLYRFYNPETGTLNIDPKTGMYAPVPFKPPVDPSKKAQ